MENEFEEPAPKYSYVTPDEYLALERASKEKHEYINGYIYAMAGGKVTHNQITRNLAMEIESRLKHTECEFMSSDMRVSIPDKTVYFYPDGLIVCGEHVVEDRGLDTLLNPKVIFEVLSRSTLKGDLGYKLSFYQQIPTLREYFTIDSIKRSIQATTKSKNDEWIHKELSEGVLKITSVDLSISFDDIYRKTDL